MKQYMAQYEKKYEVICGTDDCLYTNDHWYIVSISDMSSESEEHGREAVLLSENLLNRLTDQKSLIAQFK